MKNIHILSIIVVLLLAFPSSGQVNKVKRNNTRVDRTATAERMATSRTTGDLVTDSQQNDTIISKEMISKVNEAIKEYLENEEIDKGAAFIQSNMPDCKALKNSNICEAGLNFTSGYFYQQAARKNTMEKESYQKTAVSFYEKVLEIYPDNKLALNNLINLNKELGDTKSTIKLLLGFEQLYPQERVKYFVQIGDIYSGEGEFASACAAYRQAYVENQFSEQACGAMVKLYTNNNYPCALTSNMRQFAYDCQEIDLSNYSEKILRKEFTIAVKDQEYKKAKESMILWAKVIVDNGWLDPLRVARLNMQLFPADIEIPTEAVNIKLALTELEELFGAKNVAEVNAIGVEYWDADQPEIRVWKAWDEVRPVSVFSKLLYMKGRKAYFNGNHKTADDFWNFALEPSEYFNPTLFTIVAADLAQLYTTSKELDPGRDKFDNLVGRLFGMKGSAYLNGDKEMIRKLHITLGGVFYENKIWGNSEGFGARNAKFQLERALSEDLGPIVNPELRKMLGDVYINLTRDDRPNQRITLIAKAVDTYSDAIRDYLSLDQINKADRLQTRCLEQYGSRVADNNKTKLLRELGNLIRWRKNLADPNNIVVKGETTINRYLVSVNKAEKSAAKNLPADFVQIQFFKGLSDLGSNLSDARKKDKQLIYANALNRLKTVNDLPSTRDFNRINDIKFVLEESVGQTRELREVQMNKKAALSYDKGKDSNSRILSVPTFKKDILVPEQLFTLNDKLQDDYKKTNSRDLIKYELNKGQFELKSKDNN